MAAKEKSLPLAIGLNLLLPGLGYMYMGKWIVGIFACMLIIGVYITSFFFLRDAWLIMNLIMVIDMLILSNKNKKMVLEKTTKKCPLCAELIQKEARVCRYCGSKFDAIDNNASMLPSEPLNNEPDLLNNCEKNTTNDTKAIGATLAVFILIVALIMAFYYRGEHSVVIEKNDGSNTTNNGLTEITRSASEIKTNNDLNENPTIKLSITSESPLIEISRISEVPAAPAINVKIEEGLEGACESLRSTYVQGKLAESKGWLVASVNNYDEFTFVNIFSQAEALDRRNECWIKDGMLIIFKGESPIALIKASENMDWKTSISAIDSRYENGIHYVRLLPGVEGAPPFADMFISNSGVLIKEIPGLKKICKDEISIPNVYNMSVNDARKSLNNYGWFESEDEIGLINCTGHCLNNFSHKSGASLTIITPGNYDAVVNEIYTCDGDTDSEGKIF